MKRRQNPRTGLYHRTMKLIESPRPAPVISILNVDQLTLDFRIGSIQRASEINRRKKIRRFIRLNRSIPSFLFYNDTIEFYFWERNLKWLFREVDFYHKWIIVRSFISYDSRKYKWHENNWRLIFRFIPEFLPFPLFSIPYFIFTSKRIIRIFVFDIYKELIR